MSKRLGKREWIVAALKALSAKGIESVRVERLADVLGVSKGSFYWHFKNRDALLSAMLDTWKTRATHDVIATVEQGGGDARTRLRSLCTIVLDSDGRLDMGIRAWASKDPTVLATLASIDKRRVAYLESLFKELGFTAEEAAARARLCYNAFVGQFALNIPLKPRGRTSKQFDIILELLARNDAG